jgi:NDP-sugar pyrophosphorylase family protein
MVYGLIIAAGNQSRFKDKTPKALAKFRDKTILDINIDNMSTECDKVFVVCSWHNHYYFPDDYNKIIIDSGKGSGDAVLKALEALPLKEEDMCFIQWGDNISHDNIFYTLRTSEIYSDEILIPCVYDVNPYVQLVSIDNHIKVNFSKYGDPIEPGYHDISIFYGNASLLKYYLTLYKESICDDNTNTYKHIHNNELDFLDMFNETNIKARLLVLDHYRDLSFNTIDELLNLAKG